MNVGLVSNTYSSITNGNAAFQSAKTNADNAKFSELLETLQRQNDGRGTVSSSEINVDGRLNGEYTTGFAGAFTSEKDKVANPQGAAVNQANPHVQKKQLIRQVNCMKKLLNLKVFS